MVMRWALGLLITMLVATSSGWAQSQLFPEFNYDRRGDKAYVDSLLKVGHQRLRQAKQAPRSPQNDTLHLESIRFITRVFKQLRTAERDSSYVYALRLSAQARQYGNNLYQVYGLIQEEYYLRMVRNDFLTALSLDQKASALCEKQRPDVYPIWHIHMNMGDIYLLMKEYDNALYNYQQAFRLMPKYRLLSKRNQRLIYSQLTTQIGEVYEALGRYYQARKQYETSRQIAFETNSQTNIAYADERLGDFLISRKQYPAAVKVYQEALNIWNQLNDEGGKASVWARLAEGYFYTNRLPEAIQLGEQALVLARKRGNARIQQIASSALYQAYRASGQYERALAMNEINVALRDSLANQKQVEEMMVLQRQFETKTLRAEAARSRFEQQARIATLNRNIERQNLLRAVLLGGLVMLLAFVGVLYRRNRLIRQQRQQIEQLNVGLEDKVRRRTAELERANEQLRAKNREIEEALLRGQTLERKRVAADLHDNLGGLISAIRLSLSALNPGHLSEREQQVYKNLQHMTKEAYAEVRHLSHNLQPEELEKQGLGHALSRLGDKLNQNQLIRFSIDTGQLPRLTKATEFHLYSICLELCNNILKHSGATEACIQFRKYGEQLNMIVKDNGRGMETVLPVAQQHSQAQMNGMGLPNIQARTDAMKGRLEIYSEVGEGTTFFFILPLSATFAEASQETTS
ncbi:tetratricopeptide repeat protein [Rudanella paleaurantiibacter]|uniref:Oxygen sensor histidine kinase NreB n=2 Tax=Rudanella paleaurantiibacter TaxID=2614655 RepID=A0A7J5U518_9BACT|nr:tetratricopeptide repeat protein [Rudanella paleaurantiibacter]